MNKRIRDLQIQAFAECKTFEDDKVRTDEVFERLAINDWYPLEINGVEVINGKRLKQGLAEDSDQELVSRQISYWDQVAKEKRREERAARRAKKAEYEKTPAGKAEKYWSQKGVAEGSTEQVYKVLAVDKSNALSKQVKLKVKASSLDEVFERFAELIVRECAEVADNADVMRQKWEGIGKYVREHFGIEETKGWVCPRCGVDRTKTVCPQGYTATIEGKCPMIGVAQ